jgi:glycine oxidase
MRVLIVGAGIAGLAIGWRLAQAGVETEILERGLAGRGATWAAAGMIAPNAELGGGPKALATFARNARALWPDFAKQLEAESGKPVSYCEKGSLLVAQSAERASALKDQGATLSRNGIPAEWLEPQQLRMREPLLSPSLSGGLYMPEDAQVDNRSLPDALCRAITKAGGRLREHCEVHSLLVQGGAVRAAVTTQGQLDADLIVLACGAWMNLIGGIAPETLPPVKPAKGQMVACEPPAGTQLLSAPIWGEDVYLVPRKDRVFIGATVEDASFDISITRETRDFLLKAATYLIPEISSWHVTEMWAGLRPRTPDDAPVLGATATPGLYVASGQFRNGILFAPAVADTLCGLIMNGNADSHLDAFDPRRFADS